MIFTLDELATVLNALRYYREHNEPHQQETELIAKFSEIVANANLEPDANPENSEILAN